LTVKIPKKEDMEVKQIKNTNEESEQFESKDESDQFEDPFEDYIPEGTPPDDIEIQKMSQGTPPFENSIQGIGSEYFYFYQANDGQLAFLTQIDLKILLNEYGTYENLPDEIESEILEVENYSQDEKMRKKYKALGHLPLTASFQIIEIEVRNLVSKESIKPLLETKISLSNKRKNLKKREKEEKDREAKEKKRDDIEYEPSSRY